MTLFTNAVSSDPTRTKLIRRRFVAEMKRRFRKVRLAIWDKIVQEDVLGLTANRQEWRFRTDAGKVGAFREWLQEQIDSGILTTRADGEPWLADYIESSYKKGQLRAYREVYGDLLDSPEFQLDAGGRPIGVSFAGAEETKRIQAIYTRAWNDLKGVTDAMGQKLSRVLSLGLAQGDNPLTIARRMRKEIETLTKARANTIARTEVIAAHAEGSLDAYEELGTAEVEIIAEWSTAGDDRVCPLCQPLEGVKFTIEEARGLLPRHPNCRCALVPARREDLRPKMQKRRVRKSLLREKRSSWRGGSLVA